MRHWPALDALKPWQHHSWIFITGPGFRLKAACVPDLSATTSDLDDLLAGSTGAPPITTNPLSHRQREQPQRIYNSDH